MVKNSRFRGIFASAVAVLLFVALISSCNNIINFGGEDSSARRPIATGILAPTNNARVVVGSPVQILSAPSKDDIETIELWVKAAGEETEQFISRINLSSNGTGRQQWIPNQASLFTVMVIAFNAEGEAVETLSSQIEVIDSPAVSVVPAQAEPPPSQSTDNGAAFQSPTVTPTAIVQPEPTEVLATAEPVEVIDQQLDETASAFVIDVQEIGAIDSTAALTVTFPPPPPIPGVPYGPTQDQLPKLIPPVCDAAEVLGIFVGNDPNKREFIKEPDQVLARVAAGTTVHRAWRMRNIGTCTWGPGYELAFYGGRAMGSGGVAFEAAFPADPPRRNTVVDTNRLIVPEGKPNQTAVVELLLNTPTIPGIHQSYWRMRNPQGVYFGPIIGVTMEVVRNCNDFSQGGRRTYGAPGVDFRILGVDGNLSGNAGLPGGAPLGVTAGQLITVDWNIFNATNFGIVIESPTGDIDSLSSTDPRNRANITLTEVGIHTLTLFAENGSCVNEQVILIDVRPRSGDQFSLAATFASNAPISTSDADASFSSAVTPGTIELTWDHFDGSVDEVILHADLYRRRLIRGSCILEDYLGDLFCTRDRWEEFKLDTPRQVGAIGSTASATATLCRESPECGQLKLEIESDVQAAGGAITSTQHTNLIYCRSSDSPSVEYGVNYYVEARIDGIPADPQFSSPVFVTCNGASAAGRPGLDD